MNENLSFWISEDYSLSEFKANSQIQSEINRLPEYLLAKKMLEMQIEMIRPNLHFVLNPIVNKARNSNLLASSTLKTLVNTDAILTLIEHGHFGAALTIVRQNFEFCILAKFSSTFFKSRIFEKWSEGETISMGREIMSVLKIPSIQLMWKDLCQYTHSTKLCGQTHILNKIHKDFEYEMKASLNILIMSQFFTYKILCKYIYRRDILDMISRYGKKTELQTFKKNKALLKDEFTKYKREVDITHIKNVMREFELEWEKLKK